MPKPLTQLRMIPSRKLCIERVPLEIIGSIVDMYRRATIAIGVGSKFTRKITINAGVKQGCPLSPLLFNIVTEELLERIEQ